MAYGGIGFVEVIDDFTTDNVAATAADGIRWSTDVDAGGTAFAYTAAAEGTYVKGTTDTSDNDMCQIGHCLITWEAKHGILEMETMMQLDAITNVAFNIGFNDDNMEPVSLPVELSTADGWVSTADSWIGFVYDTDSTKDDLYCFWTDDTVDAADDLADLRMKGARPTAGEWGIYKIHLQDRGSGKGVFARFTFIDHKGHAWEKEFVTTFDRDELCTPHIAFENRSNSLAHNMQIKYIDIRDSMPA